jgi:ABC-type transporter Mla subunit MlaD
MTMSSHQQKLRATVRELERELSDANHLDAESRQLLNQAAAEIYAVLHRHDGLKATAEGAGAVEETAESTSGGGSLVDRMNDAARRFEASHPLLSGILGQIAESLGQMGI